MTLRLESIPCTLCTILVLIAGAAAASIPLEQSRGETVGAHHRQASSDRRFPKSFGL